MMEAKRKPYRFETEKAKKKKKMNVFMACIVMAVLLVVVGNSLRYLKKVQEEKKARTEMTGEE